MAAECCPVGLIYIDTSGFYDDPGFGQGNINGAPNASLYYDKCVRLILQANGTYWPGPGSEQDPIDCLCCPVGYEYSSFKGLCASDVAPTTYAEPIPCIPCVCPPDPIPVPCDIPSSSGQPIVLANPGNGRLCLSCTPQNDNSPGGCIGNFLPSNYTDPITSGFKLKNKNFI